MFARIQHERAPTALGPKGHIAIRDRQLRGQWGCFRQENVPASIEDSAKALPFLKSASTIASFCFFMSPSFSFCGREARQTKGARISDARSLRSCYRNHMGPIAAEISLSLAQGERAV